jgi:hypothetical protein
MLEVAHQVSLKVFRRFVADACPVTLGFHPFERSPGRLQPVHFVRQAEPPADSIPDEASTPSGRVALHPSSPARKIPLTRTTQAVDSP